MFFITASFWDLYPKGSFFQMASFWQRMRSVNSQIKHCLSLLQHYRDMQMPSSSEIQACYTAKTNVQSMNITITRELKKSVCIQSKNKTGKFQNFLRCSFWSTRTLASFQFRHFFHSTMQNTNYIVKNIKAFFSSWECQNISIGVFSQAYS